jgi:hypothetical protein
MKNKDDPSWRTDAITTTTTTTTTIIIIIIIIIGCKQAHKSSQDYQNCCADL